MSWIPIAGALVLAVLAFAAGRISAPTEEAKSNPPLNVPAGAGAEINTEYAHLPAGAILAAGAYQRAFADPSILEPGVLESRVKAVATPEYAPRMLEANKPGSERLMNEPVGEGVRAGVPTAYFAVPVVYHLLSYTPERARIQNWGFTILGNGSTVEPAAYFGTATTELVWKGGRWRIASTRGAFGPTPDTRTPREGAEGFDLQDLAGDFKPYGLAP
jgi:hypothetical protein